MQQWNRAELGKLANKYIQGIATDAEIKQLLDWYYAFDDISVTIPADTEEEENLLEARMLLRLHHTIETEKTKARKRIVPAWLKYSAAAAILAGISFTAFWWQHQQQPAGTTARVKKIPVPAAIVPGGNKAILTLADGSSIILDSLNNGAVTHQGNTRIIKKDNGQITYDASTAPAAGSRTAVISFNTITTPKGGQYQVILPDGSKVWLNAASSLRFPTAFTGNSREVALTGEAYFDITPNNRQPFQVAVNNMQVQVLGTRFNVMAYQDEQQSKTTLVQGSISIATNAGDRQSALLKPGQQASLTQAGKIRVANNADIDEALAWINGKFYFNDTDLSTLMRQIARWYNIDVVYSGSIPQEKFSGEIPRNSNIDEVFKILKLSNIHFTSDGHTITITP